MRGGDTYVDLKQIADDAVELVRVAEGDAREAALVDLGRQLRHDGGGEGRPLGGELVQQAAQRPHVRLLVVRLVVDLLLKQTYR